MGVPAFYRWLSERYPRIVKDVVEVESEVVDGKMLPVNTLEPNPNGEEFDHLYLDMNGIIHPCFHPEGRPAPTRESEVFECMFEYIDRIFAIVRPRKLLFMAIDGVAPRAKMNQQRSRRFKAAKEHAEKKMYEEQLRKEFADRGVVLNSLDESEVKDSNVITPGTPFMHRLSIALQYYVQKRLNEDPGWKNISVILSDSNVPGEGEHKVVDFIRRQRGLEGWNPNTRHVLYGLDADLIMLALATHEQYFYILREVVVPNQNKANNQSVDAQMHLFQMNSKEENEKKSQREILMEISRIDRKPYQMVHINILREYLILDMGNTAVKPAFKVDPERLLDDFVFLCFFCGNDFLPHMPTLEIREGAINLLISVYQQTMPTMGHLCKGDQINWKRVEVFVRKVSQHEQAIFEKRANIGRRQKNRQRQQYEADQRRAAEESRKKAKEDVNAGKKESNKSAADLLRAKLAGAPESSKTGEDASCGEKEKDKEVEIKVEIKEEQKEATKEEEEDFKEKLSAKVKQSGDKLKDVLFSEDKIRLGEDGWKIRYYQEKFQVKPGPELDKKVSEVVLNYVEGLSWVMKYYYQGCQSWAWYFGYHYAPFASDLKNLHTLDLKFDLSEPFKPLDQLMAVLPPASSHCMPRAHRELMVSEYSPIIDFYPENFPVDPNGKRYAWMHIALLPFIDEKRLLNATRPLEESLNEEETRRNSLLTTLMFVHKSHALSWNLMELEANKKDSKGSKSMNMLAEACNNINGVAVLPDGELCPKTIKSMYDCMEDIDKNKALCFTYVFPPEQIHVPRLLKGTEVPPPVLKESDTPDDPEIWHEKGRRYDHGGGAGHFMQQQILGNASSRMIYGGSGPRPRQAWGGNQGRPYGGGMNPQGRHQRFDSGGGTWRQGGQGGGQGGFQQQYYQHQHQHQQRPQYYQQPQGGGLGYAGQQAFRQQSGYGFQPGFHQQQGQFQNNPRWSGNRPPQQQQYQNNRYSPLNSNNQHGQSNPEHRPARRQRRW